jgi:hypothetical protein
MGVWLGQSKCMPTAYESFQTPYIYLKLIWNHLKWVYSLHHHHRTEPWLNALMYGRQSKCNVVRTHSYAYPQYEGCVKQLKYVCY